MKLHSIVVLFGFTAALTSAAHAEDMIWLDYPQSGVVLGQGYNLLEDKVAYGTCVNFIPVQDPSQFINFRFEEVNSHSEVQSKTKISASGSMRMAILNASARLQFLSDEKFQLDTTKFFLNAEVTNSSLFAAPSVSYKRGVTIPNSPGNLTSVDWQEEAGKNNFRIAVKDGALRNHQRCGHGFVAAIISGAAVDAFLTFSKSDADAIAEIDGGLEADIAGIFRVSGSFEQRQKSVERQDRTSISLFRYGGERGSIAFDLSGLKESIRELTQDAVEAPKPIRIGILPYSAIDTQVDVTQPISAYDYSSEINAYFLARDVFEKTSDAIDAFANIPEIPEERTDQTPLAIAKDIESYINLNDRAMNLASRLSNALRLCQGVITELNIVNAEQTDGAAASDQRIAVGPASSIRLPLTTTDSNKPLTTDADLGEAYSNLLTIIAASSGQSLEDQYAACIPSRFTTANSELSFFALAISESLSLSAEELSLRPIYWDEIGIRIQKELGRTSELEELQDNPGAAQVAYVDLLKQYTQNYLADRFRRNICSSDFTHPICTMDDPSVWKEQAVLNEQAMKVDVVQIKSVAGGTDNEGQ